MSYSKQMNINYTSFGLIIFEKKCWRVNVLIILLDMLPYNTSQAVYMLYKIVFDNVI